MNVDLVFKYIFEVIFFNVMIIPYIKYLLFLKEFKYTNVKSQFSS